MALRADIRASSPGLFFHLGGWGIGVLGHYLSVFARTGVTDRMTEQEYRKLKEEQEATLNQQGEERTLGKRGARGSFRPRPQRQSF